MPVHLKTHEKNAHLGMGIKEEKSPIKNVNVRENSHFVVYVKL